MKTIGFYAKNALESGFGNHLRELTDDNFSSVIEKIGEKCPYSKCDGAAYFNWKSKNLPLLFFTMRSGRPSKDDIEIYPSGYAVIDVDGADNIGIDTSHPSVTCLNRTKNGVHIYVHSVGLAKATTRKRWQEEYNRVAYGVWRSISDSNGKVKFDGSNSRFTQGSYLWNTDWAGKSATFDPNYESDDTIIGKDILLEMYDSKYKDEEDSEYDALVGTKNGIRKRRIREESDTTVKESLDRRLAALGVSDEMLRDFNGMRLSDFIKSRRGVFEPIRGAVPKYEPFKCYDGTTVLVCMADKSMPKVWQPFMGSRIQNADGSFKYRIAEGGRRRSLYCHLLQAAQTLKITESDGRFGGGGFSPDRLLFDAVWWVLNLCENGWKFPKTEIRQTLLSALERCDGDIKVAFDSRSVIGGSHRIDEETGELVRNDKEGKLSDTAKVRKTLRILEFLEEYDPSKPLDENIEEIRERGFSGIDGLARKTYIGYIRDAKANGELVERYPWLSDIDVKPKQKGWNRKKSIAIRNKREGFIERFGSVEECAEFLGISKKNFYSKFIKGRGLTANEWEVYDK